MFWKQSPTARAGKIQTLKNAGNVVKSSAFDPPGVDSMPTITAGRSAPTSPASTLAAPSRETSGEILTRIRQSPNWAKRQGKSAFSPDHWQKYAEKWGIIGDFTRVLLSASVLRGLVECGRLGISSDLSPATVADKEGTGRLNPTVISRPPSARCPLFVLDGTHSLEAAIARGEEWVTCLVSAEAQAELSEHRGFCGTVERFRRASAGRNAAGSGKIRYSAGFSESDHPRGQPKNAGEFAPKGGGSAGKSAGGKEKPAAGGSPTRESRSPKNLLNHLTRAASVGNGGQNGHSASQPAGRSSGGSPASSSTQHPIARAFHAAIATLWALLEAAHPDLRKIREALGEINGRHIPEMRRAGLVKSPGGRGGVSGGGRRKSGQEREQEELAASIRRAERDFARQQRKHEKAKDEHQRRHEWRRVQEERGKRRKGEAEEKIARRKEREDRWASARQQREADKAERIARYRKSGWDESKHPRGNPENAGEFSSGNSGGGIATPESESEPTKRPAVARGQSSPARREGAGKDAHVVFSDGSPAPSHITPAMIPPAWEDVQVYHDSDSEIWARGKMKNKKGGYDNKIVYRPSYEAEMQSAKYVRIREMLTEKEVISGQIQQARKNDSTRDVADCAWLIDEQATRPGSESDTKGLAKHYGKSVTAENVIVTPAKGKGPEKVALKFGEESVPIKDAGTAEEIQRRIADGESLEDSSYWLKSHGATTLEGRHVIEAKDGVRLQFVGKEGVWHDHLITDPKLAEMLTTRKASSGQRGGKLFGVSDSQLSSYVASLDHGRFSPKDFRTKRANEIAVAKIKEFGEGLPKSDDDRKERIKQVAMAVSDKLGNRWQQCVESYINPAVWNVWLEQSAGTTGGTA